MMTFPKRINDPRTSYEIENLEVIRSEHGVQIEMFYSHPQDGAKPQDKPYGVITRDFDTNRVLLCCRFRVEEAARIHFEYNSKVDSWKKVELV